MCSSQPQQNPGDEQQSQFDLPRIQRELQLSQLFFAVQKPSTNDWALELAHSTTDVDRGLFLTNHQTAGRGRGENHWLAGPGSLTFSLLVPDPCPPGNAQRCLLPLAIGCGVCEALQMRSTDLHPQIKWPNDVYLNDRKLGGILVETVAGPVKQLVIGCGLNANNELPAEQHSRAISLSQAEQALVDLTDLLIGVAGGILDWLPAVVQRPQDVVERCRRLDWLRDRPVKWVHGESCQQGTAAGIAGDGGLYLNTEGGLTVIYTGSILALEPQTD